MSELRDAVRFLESDLRLAVNRIEALEEMGRPHTISAEAGESLRKLTTVQTDEAKVAMLTVAMMLKDRIDNRKPLNGEAVQEILDGYARVERLHDLIGPIGSIVRDQANALWEELCR